MIKVFLVCLCPALVFFCGATDSYGTDLYDSALLFNSAYIQNSDINFRKISEFYGLKYKEIDLLTTTLTDALLKDEDGNYYKAIGINAATLECEDPVLLDSVELSILKHAVDSGGANLLISEVNASANMYDYSALRYLTDSTVVGASWMNGNNNWIVSESHPLVSREFTGRVVPFNGGNSAYSLLLFDPVEPIISSKDDNSIEQPMFTALSLGSGNVFVDGSVQQSNLEDSQMYQIYTPNGFHNVVPTMMFIRYAGADEVWHNDHDYANLTIDGPKLTESFSYLSYEGLLSEMESHNFHTTIAFTPKNYLTSQDAVINIFLNHPERFSLVCQGNNSDGYEFWYYEGDSLDPAHYPRPLAGQESDIVEGLTRIMEHERITGIPFGKVMIFPMGISPTQTLVLLKAYNFNATVNAEHLPLDTSSAQSWDYLMTPADLNYGCFSRITRRHPCSSYNPNIFNTDWWAFQLFVNKPLLLYSHADQIFSQGIDGFNDGADFINDSIVGSVEWRSLGDIIKKLYLQKTNDDGSIDVKFYGNNILFSNETDETHLYHFKKEEWMNVPIIQVMVDSVPISYDTVDGILQFDLIISPLTTKKILITYSFADKDFAVSNPGISIDRLKNSISVVVYNLGNDGGPCPIQFFDRSPDSGQSIALTTIERIGPGSAEVIQVPLPELSPGLHYIYVKLDPHNIILESNEANNTAFTTIEVPTYTMIDDFEYEDSPLNHGWGIYDGQGEVITVYDDSLNGRVIQATTDQGTGFGIRKPGRGEFKIPNRYVSLKINDNDHFTFYIKVRASDGKDYYVQYTPDEGVISTGIHPDGTPYVYVHIGTLYLDGSWHELNRDLGADLFAGAGVHFEYVKWFCIRGDYRLDDLMLDMVFR